MKPRHTSKNWRVDGEYGGEHQITSGHGEDQSYIARVLDRDDAHMIAAAPEMLDALIQLVDTLEVWWPKDSAFWDTNAGQDLIDQMNAGEKAIKKVKGK